MSLRIAFNLDGVKKSCELATESRLAHNPPEKLRQRPMHGHHGPTTTEV